MRLQMSLFGKVFLNGFLRWFAVSLFIFGIIFLFKVIYDPAALNANWQEFALQGLRFALLFSLVCGIADVAIHHIKSLKRNESKFDEH